MSHSSQTPAYVSALRDLSICERLYRIVSFTENINDHISPQIVYYLSVMLGNQDWMDDLLHVRKGFPKSAGRQYFQTWLDEEMNNALIIHCEHLVGDSYSLDDTIRKQDNCVAEFKNNMKWENWVTGYQGVIVKSDYVDVLEKTERFVQYFESRWRHDSPKTEYEQGFVWDRYRCLTSLDWISNPAYFDRMLNEMEEEFGAPDESAPN